MAEDYVASHLQWISNNPKFTCREQSVFSSGATYFQIMNELYHNQQGFPGIQEYAKRTFIQDKAWQKHQLSLNKEIDDAVKKLEPTPNGRWFVTIGYNHQTFDVKKSIKAINKIIAMDWIKSVKAVHENFRSNGEHPHVHFIIETSEPKSRILDKLWRPQYIKELVLSRSFIDIKIAGPQHDKYLDGEKVEEKQECLKMDAEWRTKHNVPHVFSKNWA